MARSPILNPDKDKYNKSNKYLKDREESTPIYQRQDFIPPATLTDKELVVWSELVEIFRGTINCMVSDADIHLMELYCRAKVATDEADEAIKVDPRAYIIVPLGKDKDGNVKTTAKPNPNYKIRNDNALLCRKLFMDLGLSPVARAKAGIAGANAQKNTDIFMELMNRGDD